MNLEHYEQIPLPDTRTAFDRCTSIPRACESCPLRNFPELTDKPDVRKENCMGTLTANVRYWLERAETRILANSET